MTIICSRAEIPQLGTDSHDAALRRHRDHWYDVHRNPQTFMVDPLIVRDWTGHGTLMLSMTIDDWDRPIERGSLIDLWNRTADIGPAAGILPSDATMAMVAALAMFVQGHTAASVVSCFVTGINDPDYCYTLRYARQPELDEEIRGGLEPW